MNDWRIESIGAVAKIISGGTPKSQVSEYWNGGIPWITPKDMGQLNDVRVRKTSRTLSEAGIKNSSAKLVPENSVILSTRAPIGHLAINEVPMSFNQGCRGLVPSEQLDARFLFYYLKANVRLLNELGTGATFRELAKSALENINIPLPPLSEQQRIVAILDEAFAGIDAAIENTKRNLANARELFKSYLNNVFTQKGDGWVERNIGEIATHSLGKMLDKKKNKGTLQPYLRNLNVRWFNIQTDDVLEMRFEDHEREKYTVCKGDLLICEGGYPGRAAMWDSDEPIFFQKALHRVRHSNPLYAKWILYYLSYCDATNTLKNHFTGAGIQHFTGKALHNFPLPLAPVKELKSIICKFELLHEETQELENVYKNKLEALTELKQSLLQKAFSGELTSSIQTASPEFSAHILAFAYARHRSNRRNKTFGRVKAQKTLHLVESIGGVDLGRAPKKDAAGPNDSAHMRQAENWAVANDYFEFAPRGEGGYDFRPRSGFDKRLVEGCAKFEEYRSKIERVVDLLLPMDSEEAEVFATVHAAWNNLVSDELEVTDQKILWEARNNWHAGKLDIPEEKFREATRYIRSNNLIPDGTAKIVKGQESLF